MSVYQRKPDMIIRGGTILDGTGSLPFYADLAIRGDKIDYIGDLKGVEAPVVIDATGKYVTPGFIDAHGHSDFTIWANPECESALQQGTTTQIVGNCGFSKRHGLGDIPFDPAGDGVTCVYDLPGPDFPKGSMAAVLDKMDAMGASMNTLWLCGHNDLRIMADLYTREYTEAQFSVMEDFLREALEAGFAGFSTGLEFIPGVVSEPEEVERLAAVAAEYDANYSTHMRDEGLYILESIEEFLNVIRKTHMRGTISHLNVKYDNSIPNEYLQIGMQKLKDAREQEHLNVFADMLPTCFASGDSVAMLPPWLYAEGWDKAREILADPEGRGKVKADMNRYWRFLAAGQWDRLLFMQADYMPEVSTMPFGKWVEKCGKEPVDCFLDIMQAAPTFDAAQQVGMQGNVFHEQTMVDSVVRDPIYLWQTDSRVSHDYAAGAKVSRNNIQDYISMLYFFVRYVRELKAIPLEKAVEKATSLPAKHYKIEKRGQLTEGYYADINVFDLDALTIHATFAQPCRYCSGMDYVIVNGVPVIAGGQHTGARSGRALRHLRRTE